MHRTSWGYSSNQSNLIFIAYAARLAAEDSKTDASAGRPADTETNQNLKASAEIPAVGGSDIVNVDSVRPNNFHIFVHYVPHDEKVFSNLRQKLGRKSGDDMNDLDTNSLILCMSVTLDAAVHIGKELLETSHSSENQSQRTIRKWWQRSCSQIKQKFKENRRLIGTHIINSKSLCILRFSIVSGQGESTPRVQRRMEKGGIRLNIEGWIESSGKCPSTHYITDSRRDP